MDASFAMGDIIIAEPNALIGFAGPRVIDWGIRQSCPLVSSARSFSWKGFVDMICDRREMKQMLERLIRLHGGREEKSEV